MPAIDHATGETLVAQRPMESTLRRRRLVSMVELARIYGDLGVKELADAVGRDKTRIIPPTGNPKMDMVGSLAGLLEWTVTDVVNALQGTTHSEERMLGCRRIGARHRFEKLRRISKRLERKGRSNLSRSVAGMLLLQSENGRERSIALEMIGRSQMNDGDLTGALCNLRKGLEQGGLEFKTHVDLKMHLCRTHLRMHHHLEARSVASELLEMIKGDTHHDRKHLGEVERSARYVRANAVRACIDQGIGIGELRRARRDLLRSLQSCEIESTRDLDERTVTLGAILELDATLGTMPASNAIHKIEKALDEADARVHGGSIENRTRRAWAWWGIFGARIALRSRHVHDVDRWEKAHRLARKAAAFSSEPDDGLLRSDAYQLSFQAWQEANRSGRTMLEWHMEPDELTLFVRTMGAGIGFMEPGWRILRETGTLDRAKSMDPRTWRKGFHRT